LINIFDELWISVDPWGCKD